MDPASTAGRLVVALIGVGAFLLSLLVALTNPGLSAYASLATSAVIAGFGLRAAMDSNFVDPGRSVGGGVLLPTVPIAPDEQILASANGGYRGARTLLWRPHLRWCRVFLTDRRVIAIPYRFTFVHDILRVALADVRSREGAESDSFLTDGMLGVRLKLADGSQHTVFAAADAVITILRSPATSPNFAATTEVGDDSDGLGVAIVWFLAMHTLLLASAAGASWLLIFAAIEVAYALRLAWLWTRRRQQRRPRWADRG